MHYFLVTTLLITLLGCAGSGTIGQEEYDDSSSADGAAFRTDAIHIRKPMEGHLDWRPVPFYYKHCSEARRKVLLFQNKLRMHSTLVHCNINYFFFLQYSAQRENNTSQENAGWSSSGVVEMSIGEKGSRLRFLLIPDI